MKNGKYFVVNEDDLDTAPGKIYFTLDDAVEHGAVYIDVFDENGEKICFYEKEDGEYVRNDI